MGFRSSDAPYLVAGLKTLRRGKNKSARFSGVFSCCGVCFFLHSRSIWDDKSFTPRKRKCYVHAMTSRASAQRNIFYFYFFYSDSLQQWGWWEVSSIKEEKRTYPAAGLLLFHFLFIIFFFFFFCCCWVTPERSPLVRPPSRGTSSPPPAADSHSRRGLWAWLLPFPENHVTAECGSGVKQTPEGATLLNFSTIQKVYYVNRAQSLLSKPSSKKT